MTRSLTAFVVVMVVSAGAASGQTVSNVWASQQPSGEVRVVYDLSGGTPPLYARLEASSDGGTNWAVPVNSLSGNGITAPVTPGLGKVIVWNAMADWPGQVTSRMSFRVSVSQTPPLTAPVLISPGSTSTNSNTTFVWNAVNGADSYRIIIRKGSRTVVDRTVTETSFTTWLPNSYYYWSVTAASQGQYGPASAAKGVFVYTVTIIEI